MVSEAELTRIINENRKRIVTMVYKAGVGHVGGSLSVIDILTVIYENEIDFNNEQRSKLILSKGHATPALYAELIQKGVISNDEMDGFRKINSRLQGHPNSDLIPEIDATTGLLGQGFSVAVGSAIVKKNIKSQDRVYAICGDGELQEGQNWEALMLAGHKKLDNITFIVDYNKLSSIYPTNSIVNLEPLKEKFISFNCYVIEIDGHNVHEILEAIEIAKKNVGKPTVIISHTIKGKGVSFMENNGSWHSKGLTDQEYQEAMNELSGGIA